MAVFPFGVIASAAGGVLSSIMSNNSAQAALDAQRQENVLNRKFNSEEAQKSRDFQRLMFDAENAYNDPKRVISRLMSAGLNPALAFGNFANSASVSGGSSASYGNGVNPAMPDWTGIQSAGRAALDNEMIQAQIKLAESQANNLDTQTEWIPKVKSQEIKESLSRIGVNHTIENVNEETAKSIVKGVEALDKQISLWDSQIDVNKVEKLYKVSLQEYQDILNKYADESQKQTIAESRQRCRHLASMIGLNEQEADQIAQLLPYSVTIAKTQAYESENVKKVLEYYYDKNYHEIAATWRRCTDEEQVMVLRSLANGRDVDFLNAFLNAASSAVGLGIDFYKAKRSNTTHIHNTNVYNR